MNRELLRGFLQIGVFVGGGGFLLAFFTPRDSAEYVVSVCSGVIGTLLILAVVGLSRLMR